MPPRRASSLRPSGLPWRSLEDGWVLRNKVVWAKTNPMPTSARDRLSCTHEVVYFFVREPHYYFDLDAIRVPHSAGRAAQAKGVWPGQCRIAGAGLQRAATRASIV